MSTFPPLDHIFQHRVRSHAEITAHLEQLKEQLLEKFGVTLETDYEGEHGPAGATYLTIHWSPCEGAIAAVRTQVQIVGTRPYTKPDPNNIAAIMGC